MMCSTGVILSIPLNSLLSQKHKPLFFCWRDGGWGSFVPSLDPDTNLEASEPQGPSVWELPSPRLGSECQEAASRGLGVSLGLGLTSLEMKNGRAEHGHLAGAYTVISGKLWPKICHV